MFDAQSFGWLVDFASWLLVAFVLMVLLSLLGRLFGSPGSNAASFDYDLAAPGTSASPPSYNSRTMVSESTGRPLVTPNALVDMDLNPRVPEMY